MPSEGPQVLGDKQGQLEKKLDVWVELELATLQALGSAPILQRPILPNGKSWQTFP